VSWRLLGSWSLQVMFCSWFDSQVVVLLITFVPDWLMKYMYPQNLHHGISMELPVSNSLAETDDAIGPALQ
jgi:hypothetical protein